MIAALLYGNDLHHLDHLAPICSLLEIPLFVNDDEIFNLALKFYPNLNVAFIETAEISSLFLKNFKYIISCLTKPFLNFIFFPYEKLFKERITPIWCPHGNSDKGLNSNYFDPLKNEECLLVYGKKMLDIFKQKKILNSGLKIIEVGNYRKAYYKKYYQIYQLIIKEQLFALKTPYKKYLYAPTWEDSENNSSMPLYLKDISKTIKENDHLFIKLHPNSMKKDDFYSNKHIWEIEKNPQITFIEKFPPIYPIIDNIDAFLGDFSSIGYDVLSFNKPMGFLLPPNKTIEDSNLFKCGINFSKFRLNKNYFEDILKKSHHYKLLKEQLYAYTYTDNPNWKKELFKICQ